jgi:hypothetical protein
MGQGGEMAQTMYAHMNKYINEKKGRPDNLLFIRTHLIIRNKHCLAVKG